MRSVALMAVLTLFSFSQECRVAIDIGHSPKNPGALSSRGVGEYQFNRRAGLTLYHYLQDAGIDAFFVNSEEKEISLAQRAAAAESLGGTHFVSIHHDSVKEKYLSRWSSGGKSRYFCDDFSGFGVFVSKKNKYFEESLHLASLVGGNLRALGLYPSYHHAEDIKGERKTLLDRENGVYRYDNLIVLKTANLPSLLVECGIILNRDDERYLWSKRGLDNTALAITEAFKSVCMKERGEL